MTEKGKVEEGRRITHAVVDWRDRNWQDFVGEGSCFPGWLEEKEEEDGRVRVKRGV